jgi:hypothetical protein
MSLTYEKFTPSFYRNLLDYVKADCIKEARACFELPMVDVNYYFNLREGFFIEIAILYGSKKCLEYLLGRKDIDVNSLDSHFMTLLERVMRGLAFRVTSFDPDNLQKLLAVDELKVNNVGFNGSPLLHRVLQLINKPVCRKNLMSFFKELLKHKTIDVNLVDSDQCTALQLAVVTHQREAVEALVAHPACQVNLIDNLGRTALHWSIYFREQEITRLLLKTPATGLFEISNDFQQMAMAAILCSEVSPKRLPISVFQYIFSFWRIPNLFQEDLHGLIPWNYTLFLESDKEVYQDLLRF